MQKKPRELLIWEEEKQVGEVQIVLLLRAAEFESGWNGLGYVKRTWFVRYIRGHLYDINPSLWTENF